MREDAAPQPPTIRRYCQDCGSPLVLWGQHGYDITTGEPLYAWRCPNYRWLKHLLLEGCYISTVATRGGEYVRVDAPW